jgi:hypothetical protein
MIRQVFHRRRGTYTIAVEHAVREDSLEATKFELRLVDGERTLDEMLTSDSPHYDICLRKGMYSWSWPVEL